jgi:hypothetical protein
MTPWRAKGELVINVVAAGVRVGTAAAASCSGLGTD